MYVEVLKPLTADGETLASGAIVDASGWRWTKQLIDQRYIRPVPAPRRTAKEQTHA